MTGGVLSSVGKGLLTASIGRILKNYGIRVVAIKIDPYLNVDAGTMNPYVHGEVFVTRDGGETDLDIGHYERFLDVDLGKDCNVTTGQVYLSVIQNERRGIYLGRCVQIIPHITDEIKRRIRHVGDRYDAEVVLVEIGGTVGDIEGQPFLEAIRQMRIEEGWENTVFVHIALAPILETTGEFKTKPVQHSVQELRRIGIQPDFIVVRASVHAPEDARNKIALFGNVPPAHVFSSPTLPEIYLLPRVLEDQGLGKAIMERLGIKPRDNRWREWNSIVDQFVKAETVAKVAICGKYSKMADCYVSLKEAIKHAAASLGAHAQIRWFETEDFEAEPRRLQQLDTCDAVIVPGGFGQRGAEGKIMVAEYCRTHQLPFLGICFGFQLAVVEVARNLLHLEGANSTEIDPETPHPVVDLLPEQRQIRELGGTMRLGDRRIRIKKGTLAYRIYGKEEIVRRHRHRYEVNPEYVDMLSKVVVFSGVSEDGHMSILELPEDKHPFFIATQYHPEFSSRPGKPEPVFVELIRSGLERRLR